MKTSIRKLHWNVMAEDYNSRKIVSYDIFSHISFVSDLKKAFKKAKDEKEFLEMVHSDLRYYFWAKCEHEVYVDGLFDKDGSEKRKIDVYEQVMLNWDQFARYVVEGSDFGKQKPAK